MSEKSCGFDRIGSWKVRPCLVCFFFFFELVLVLEILKR